MNFNKKRPKTMYCNSAGHTRDQFARKTTCLISSVQYLN